MLALIDQEVRQSPGTKPGFFYGYVIVVAAFFSMMMIFGMHNTFGVFFKPVLTEFGWARGVTSGAFSLAMIMVGLLGVFMGGLNDRFGPRIVLSLCGFLFGLGFLLMSQISAVWQLYLFYGIIIGSGVSGAWVPLMSTVARWFSERRGLMSGVVLGGVSIGGLITPLVATQLISTYDWRTTYIILGGVALVITISAAQFLRRDPAQMGQLPYGSNKGGEPGLELSPEGFTFKDAVYTRQFWLFFSLLFCSGFSMYGAIVHIVPHAIDLGFSPPVAASLLATLSGLSLVGRIGLGGAADRIGNKRVFIISFILMSGSLLWLAPAVEVWQLYLFVVVFGFAYGGLGVVESPLTASLFGLGSHGLIYGVLIVGWTLGAAASPFVTGYMFDVTGSYQTAFLLGAAVGILGLILTAVLKPIGGGKI